MMMTSRVGQKLDRSAAKTSNGQTKDLKPGRVDTSDSATPETGDEADDDRSSSERGEGDPLRNSDDENFMAAPQNTPEASRNPKSRARAPLSIAAHDVLFEDGNDGDGEWHEVKLKSQHEFAETENDGDYDVPGHAEEAEQRGPRRLPSRSAAGGGNEDEVDDEDDDDDSLSEVSQKPETRLWQARMKCGKIVNNEYVQITIIFLIIFNALMMGLATFDFVTEDPNVENVFARIDKGFLVVFTAEVVMQLFYLGMTLFADGWLVFDLLIVIFSWAFEGLQIVRAFRIFRAFRLITRVKPLRDLVLAIGAVMPRMYAIAALLLLIFYIFSVLFTDLFADLPLEENYFRTLDASLFTCMEMMTLEWGDIARETMELEHWAWAPFTAFIMVTGFIVFNLIVAVVCDAVAVTEKTVRELDGFESDDPAQMIDEAQERIDLLQCHISDMLRTQQSVQDMIEVMAGELLHLEAERMKAEHREAELRIEMQRRMQYQKNMESKRQIDSLGRTYVMEKERRDFDKKMKEMRRNSSMAGDSDHGSLHGSLRESLHESVHESVHGRLDESIHEERKVPRRGSVGPGTGDGRLKRRGSASSSKSGSGPGFVRDSSFRSGSSRSSRGSIRNLLVDNKSPGTGQRRRLSSSGSPRRQGSLIRDA